jgi:hypothetical protein
MVRQQEQRFAIVFKKLDEIVAPKSKTDQRAFNLSKQESDEIDQLRRLAQEIAEQQAPRVVTST